MNSYNTYVRLPGSSSHIWRMAVSELVKWPLANLFEITSVERSVEVSNDGNWFLGYLTPEYFG